jgi:hypothetical protein
MSSNPLQQYFRQPKMFVSLPSKGLFYKEGALQGDAGNVPIFAMTGMDEIIMKTPDALFSGEATVKLIESCCPYIKDAKSVPSLDIDVLLVAIRAATFGEDMNVVQTCSSCGTDNEYAVKLNNVLDHYSEKTFDSTLNVGELTIHFRPLSYEEMSKTNLENFKLQRILAQLSSIPDNERQEHLDKIYQELANIQIELFVNSIESIQTPTATVTEKDFIREWLANAETDNYRVIKSKLEANKEAWSMPKFPVKCNECGHENEIDIVMDQSNFFV